MMCIAVGEKTDSPFGQMDWVWDVWEVFSEGDAGVAPGYDDYGLRPSGLGLGRSCWRWKSRRMI